MTSPSPPRLTDRAALLRQRRRIARAPALFLHGIAADEIDERLSTVNRRFTRPAIVAPMHEFWRERLPQAVLVEDAEILPLEPGAHDLVIHAMCLHWADDPVGQLIQCRMALAPDGLLLAVLPAGRTLAGLRATLAESETMVSGGLSPRVLPMADIRDLGGLMQRAGFALPVADSVEQQVSYADLFALMHDLRSMGEGNALADRRRVPARRELFNDAARRYAAAYPAPGGRILAEFELVFLAGWSPGAGQPMPLRPGSASTRLADALGAEETRLPGDKPPRND